MLAKVGVSLDKEGIATLMEGIKTGNLSAATLARACGDTKQMAKSAQNFFEREAAGQIADMSVSQARYLLKTGEQAYKTAGGTIRLGNAEILKLLDNFADDIAADVAAETLAAQIGRTRTMEAIESMLDKTTFEAIKDTIEGRGLEQAELEKLNQVIRSYSMQKGEQMSTSQIRGLLKDGSYLTKSVDDVVAGLVKGSAKYFVDPAMFLDDEAAGVLINGSYIKNPTAKQIEEYISAKSNYLGNKNMNGKYMYVIDPNDNIIIGTRAKDPITGETLRMPHPTLIGGSNPEVQAAGMLEIRGGKIYAIDNVSGHFKPSPESLKTAKEVFERLPHRIFSKDFQGYISCQY